MNLVYRRTQQSHTLASYLRSQVSQNLSNSMNVVPAQAQREIANT